jgi:hypothetical protein
VLCLLLVEWLLVYCYSSLGALRVRPENVTWLDTAGVKPFLPGFHLPENRKDGSCQPPEAIGFAALR